ncbi:glycosyl hydrolase [bacterium]|nr:glycosyl hydrolase [bacterium]
MRRIPLILCVSLLLYSGAVAGGKSNSAKDKSSLSSNVFSGLRWRNIGPAFCSGRIGDFAVNPENTSEYYVAVASGNIWKTVNHGVTWKPVFDNYGSYAIGCVVMDPGNHNVVWAGTGENNSQRALGYGDGVYKTIDGGKSWKNMGLKNSRQIGEILVDPRNSDVVYVAAEGSVWGPGAERGLYKTTDGGKTWKAVLTISEHTGVSDITFDPRNPDVIYAASHQRRRHVFTKIDGGPETAIYKTVNAGKTWDRLKKGLPGGDMGAIGLAVSPVNPDFIYAIIEAAGDTGGFFRSTDRGASWKKMSSHVASSPQHYNEIFCDPQDADKVYSVETVTQYTDDGGRSWHRLGLKGRHVDDHALWINPEDTRHLLIGGDGGIYESWDAGSNWQFKPNLPVTQFYRVGVDNSKPFYYVYGGTQDNNSMGGPSRTLSRLGIINDDWFVTNGGDGFWTAVDPENPDIVYAESQYGYMVRYDRKSGESISIKPQPRKGEDTYKWNWDTPLFVSNHAPGRLYCAANKVFRSEDRGNSWTVISDDLTRQIDRNTLPVMGKVWSVDAVAKNASTSLWGTIVSLAESKLDENLIYAGTDDGLIQITEDQNTWRNMSEFPGVPGMTYVSDICPSRHDVNVVYATFNNHKRDDFKPYVYKSTDKGRSWKSIVNNLPANGPVHTFAQDPVNANLLFIGTEFTVFFSVDGGKEWVQLKNDLPTISVKDIAIQERENDLVIATFGRGFYIIDDYTPLRHFTRSDLDKKAMMYPIKDALQFVPKGGKYGQGSTYYAAENPPVAATFTLYLKDIPKSLKAQRKEKEKKLDKDGKAIPYPSWDALRAEDNEEKIYLLFTIMDDVGKEIRKLAQSPKKGIGRYTWDMRDAGTRPVRLTDEKYDPLSTGSAGNLVAPGRYHVSVSLSINGQISELVGAQSFNVIALNNTTLPAEDRKVLAAFQREAAELYRVVQGSINAADELQKRIAFVKQAVQVTPGAPGVIMADAMTMEKILESMMMAFNGDPIISRHSENPLTSISGRLRTMAFTHRRSTAAVTQTEREAYRIIREEFGEHYDTLKQMIEIDVVELEKKLESIKAPWTPGRLPDWKK